MKRAVNVRGPILESPDLLQHTVYYVASPHTVTEYICCILGLEDIECRLSQMQKFNICG